MANATDKKVQELFKIVQIKKAEITKAEKPNWVTNCSFSYNRDSSYRMNLQTITDLDELASMLAFLIDWDDSQRKALEILGITGSLKWHGYTLEEWKEDIQTRVNKIQISEKKIELEILEKRLNSLISPELKAEMELADITKQLLS